MNSRRRSQDPKEKKEGKNEQTGISYFDWRNAKRKSKGKEKIRVTRKDSFCLFRLPCQNHMWKCSPWQQGCHGGSTPRGRTCTLSGRCTLCPLTRLKKIKLVKKKLLQWINVQRPTSESCTLQNRTFSQLKNISLWETLSLWFVCLLIFPWEKTADKQKFYKKTFCTIWHCFHSPREGSAKIRALQLVSFFRHRSLFFMSLCCSMNNAKF